MLYTEMHVTLYKVV